MKKIILTLTMLLTCLISIDAMSYSQARREALFLTDKMAYELNLTDSQYDAAYEINLDYLMGITTPDDLYGTYWSRRNLDLGYVLLDWQWRMFEAATYFYRPLYWNAGYWHFGIYSRYPHRTYFYFDRPTVYVSYCGGHSWRSNGGRSWYESRRGDFRHGTANHSGMRDRWDKGERGRGHGGDKAFADNGNHGGMGGNNGNNGNNAGTGSNSTTTLSQGGRQTGIKISQAHRDDIYSRTTTTGATARATGTLRGNGTTIRSTGTGVRLSGTQPTTTRPTTSLSNSRVTLSNGSRATSIERTTPLRQTTTQRTISTPQRQATTTTPRSVSTPSRTISTPSRSISTPSRSVSTPARQMSTPTRTGGNSSRGVGGGNRMGGRR